LNDININLVFLTKLLFS